MNSSGNHPRRDILYSKKVRAGKRTYYFDVKLTRSQDFYLTITESKSLKGENEENPVFERHKLFIYKEDLNKFNRGLTEALDYIKTNQKQEMKDVNAGKEKNDTGSSGFTDLEFEDL